MVSESITFNLVTYAVTFTEKGLPAGATWSVTLAGVAETSTQNTITFNEPNGTYAYTIHLPNGYQSSTLKGSKTVSGNSATIVIPVQPASNDLLYIIVIVIVLIIAGLVAGVILMRKKAYVIEFIEKGLPAGTTWHVQLSDGQTYTSTTDTILIKKPNGEYTYTVSTEDKEYIAVQETGTIAVKGASVSESITFSIKNKKLRKSKTKI
jgi:hypothetical protein